jgi:isoquinoline 1-oxidoreductase beta subunit
MSERNRQFMADNAPSSRFGVASIEAWPAAGGGLLVGKAEPAFVGAAPVRTSVKTVFLRLDRSGEILLMIPYVALEAETRACIRAVVSDELHISESAITVSDDRSGAGSRIIDLHPVAERSLQACAAAARALLLEAAAETWQVSSDRCETASGLIRTTGRAIAYRDLAAEAALASIPRRLSLRCGRLVDMVVPPAPAADTNVSPIPTCR